jgi:hypothetical protein
VRGDEGEKTQVTKFKYSLQMGLEKLPTSAKNKNEGS